LSFTGGKNSPFSSKVIPSGVGKRMPEPGEKGNPKIHICGGNFMFKNYLEKQNFSLRKCLALCRENRKKPLSSFTK
jgi:hypothetical protein